MECPPARLPTPAGGLTDFSQFDPLHAGGAGVFQGSEADCVLMLYTQLFRRSEFGTNKKVKARIWPWLEPFSVRKYLQKLKLFPPRSQSARARFEDRKRIPFPSLSSFERIRHVSVYVSF